MVSVQQWQPAAGRQQAASSYQPEDANQRPPVSGSQAAAAKRQPVSGNQAAAAKQPPGSGSQAARQRQPAAARQRQPGSGSQAAAASCSQAAPAQTRQPPGSRRLTARPSHSWAIRRPTTRLPLCRAPAPRACPCRGWGMGKGGCWLWRCQAIGLVRQRHGCRPVAASPRGARWGCGERGWCAGQGWRVLACGGRGGGVLGGAGVRGQAGWRVSSLTWVSGPSCRQTGWPGLPRQRCGWRARA